MSDDASARLDVLAAEARYARERRDLYRARLLTGKPANPVRMRELERLHDQTAERLAVARREAARPA
jgi:hypothetical protein